MNINQVQYHQPISSRKFAKEKFVILASRSCLMLIIIKFWIHKSDEEEKEKAYKKHNIIEM
jgi:hypothetical protein